MIEDSVQWVENVLIKLQLPLLSDYGLCNTMFEEVAEDALRTNAIKGNPLPLNQQRLITILRQVCHNNCHA